VKGYIDDKEFEQLIERACGFLVVQDVGFGAPNRITTMSCAGIPVITSSLSYFTLELPPGVVIVKDKILSWRDAMIMVQERYSEIANTQEEYEAWEKEQGNELKSLLINLLPVET
jgi:hypothetical protein